MIKVYYEEYYNDFRRKDMERTFSSLKEVEDWVFEQMRQDYTKPFVMYFPTPEQNKRFHWDGASRIEFAPSKEGPEYWIHEMKSDTGIIFTDGKYTAGQKHWSKEVQDWLRHCDARQHAPKFQFVE